MNNKIEKYLNEGGTIVIKNIEKCIILMDNNNLKIIRKIENNIEIIKKANNIWYMNGNKKDIYKWHVYYREGFLTTWNHKGKNDKLKEYIQMNDIIAWYIVGCGYNSIVKINGSIREITDKEIDTLVNSKKEKEEWKQRMLEENYKVLVIPVDFLATSSNIFVNNVNIPEMSKEEWTFGLRGSNCMKPLNRNWKEQVIKMYKYMDKV